MSTKTPEPNGAPDQLDIHTLLQRHPLPWRVDSVGYIFDADDAIVASMGNHLDSDVVSRDLGELVVRMVNKHQSQEG